jgi:molecular chaperone DnaK
LSEEEIKKMKQEAETNAEADRKLKEETDKVNNADSMIFTTEKQLKEFGEKIPADKKAPIESALAELKEAHKNRDLPKIDTALAALNSAWTAASEDMYKASQDGAAGAGTGETAGGQPDTGEPAAQEVTDVDFEEIKDDNNKK